MPEATDLSEFHKLTKKRVPWDQRALKIRERFPSVFTLDWNAAFSADLDLFARVLRDILKLEQALPGRPGPRPSLDVHTATKRLQQFFGRDYSIEPFPTAFRILARGRSHRHLSAKTGLNRNTIQRLLAGEIEPGLYEMEKVAEAFGKHGSYFLEYRLLYIVAALASRLEWSPETTVGLYRDLAMGAKRA